MNKVFLTIAAAATLIFNSATWAGDPPTVKLDARTQYNRDSKIALKVEGLDKVKARLKWWVRSTEGRTTPEVEICNNTCFVWAGPGRYEVLITIGVVDGQDLHWIDLEHKFAVGDASPQPDPPRPGPSPIVPGDFGDIKAKIKEIVDPVRDDDKAGATKIIAKAFKTASEAAAKGEYKDAVQLADATSSEFVYELGLNRYLRWRPAMSKLREHYAALLAEGKLKTMQDWAELWSQYAKAFEEYK